MKNIFMLSFANLRKAKGNFISLLIMFIISSLLFNAGLLVLINFSSYFDDTTAELNTSDTYFMITDNLYSESLEEYIFNHENIEEVQKELNLWKLFDVKINGKDITTPYTINNIKTERSLSKWKLVGDSLPLDDMSVYLPISYHLTYDIEINDDFSIKSNDLTLNFKVAGFVEDIFTTTPETGFVGLYVNDSTFKYLEANLGEEARVIKIFANIKELNKDIEIGIKERTGAETLSSATDFTNGMFGMDVAIIKLSRVMMATMISLIFVAFAALIVVACLLVVRFRINNTIEDDITKIGTLKALGYTSRQIILSIIIQFTLIASIGSLIGISLSYLTIPTMSDMFSTQSALIWKQGFDLSISIFTFLFVNSFVILVSLFTSRKIHKLHPIIALRGGIVNHNFRKNFFPLDKSKLDLTNNLAFKSIFNNLKQSLMIVIISLAIAFAGSFAVLMFYNTNIDITTFKETPGVEMSNIAAYLDSSKDNTEIVKEFKNLENVRKVQFIDITTVFIDGLEINLYVMEDFTQKETNTIYEGRYPLHHNEISLNGYLAEIIDKKIGDVIEVKYRDNIEEYIITGFSQGATMLGMNGFIKLDGIKKINPDFKNTTLQIYLTKETNTEDFMKYLVDNYSSKVLGFIDIDKNMEEGSKSYVDIVSSVGIAILVITTIIIILVLYLVINSSIIRNKRFIGIQKSLGFTTYQLMMQIALIFIFPTILGVIIGAFLGTILTNPMLSIVQKSMGVMKANYIISPIYIVIFGLIIVIISFITSLIVTYKIRKISAYSLITE